MMVVIVVMIICIMLVLTRIVTFMMQDVMMLGDTFQVCSELTMALTLRERTDLHVDIATCHARLLINVPHREKITFDLNGKLMPQFLVSHLAATELELDTHFVTFREEVFRVSDLDQVIMRVDADTEFHLLHLATLLMLVSLLLVLLKGVLVFAVIDDLAHRWIGIWRDFDEVKPTFFGDADSLRGGQDTELMLTIFLDDANLRRANALIDASLIHIATWPFTTTATALVGTRRATSSCSRSGRTRWSTSACSLIWPWCTGSSSLWPRRSASLRRTRLGGLVLLRWPWWRRSKIAAIQGLEWVANRIPPGVFSASARVVPRQKRVSSDRLLLLSYQHRPAQIRRNTTASRAGGSLWRFV